MALRLKLIAYKSYLFLKLFVRNPYLKGKKEYHRKKSKLNQLFFQKELNVDEYWSNRYCPCCFTNSTILNFNSPQGYSFASCDQCDMVFMNPIPSATALDRLYKSEHYASNQSGSSNAPKPVQSMGFSDLDYILKYVSSGKLLDIGTGAGGFLKTTNKYFDSEGLEVNSIVANRGISEGLKIKKIYSNNFKPDSLYNIITMLQVIEHVPDPGSIVVDVHRLLEKDGIFYLACPNLDSWSFKLFKNKHRHIFDFTHLNMYTINTLKVQIERYGFKLHSYETYDLDIELYDLFAYYFTPSHFVHRFAYYNPFVMQFGKIIFTPIKIIITKLLIKRNKGSYLRAIFVKT